MVNYNNKHYRKDEDIPLEKRQGSGGGRPLNEDVEKRYDPSQDYKNYKDGSHERISPTISEENYYFGDD